jgi:hypothetical protein
MTIPWLRPGAHVRDRFGEWTVVACPKRVKRVGEAAVDVTDAHGSSRSIWLLEFLRDFQPCDTDKQR